MNDTRWARDALPGPEPCSQPFAVLLLDKHVEISLQHEETFLDFMRMRGVALARLHIHDREREIACRDHGRVAVFAGAARADETMLGALVALDLGIFESRPVGFLLFEAADVFLHDLVDRHTFKLLRPRMPCNTHGVLLLLISSQM